jgi:hypothetical protein
MEISELTRVMVITFIYNFSHLEAHMSMLTISSLVLEDNGEFTNVRTEPRLKALGAWTSQWRAELSCICKIQGSEPRILG